MTKEERKAALQAGAALVLEQGATWSEATHATGISRAALGRAIARMRDDPDRVKQASDALAAANITIATEAAERVYGKLDELAPAELIRVWGIASDKVALHQGWGRDRDQSHASTAADALAKLADAIASGGTLSVTVTPPDPASSAIDVTPSEDGS